MNTTENVLRIRLSWIVGALLVSACGHAGLLDTGEAPDNEPVGTARDQVVFGTDTRAEYGAIQEPRSLAFADSTAALFASSKVVCAGGSCNLTTSPFTSGTTPTAYRTLCQDAPFRNQPQGAFCTAFLIGPDVFATAGHCFNCTANGTCPPCSGDSVVFGFNADANGQNVQTTVPSSNVYACTGTPIGINNDAADYAIFRVDRVVSGRTPLIAQYSGHPNSADELAVLGHPDGLPLKFARDGWVKTDDPQNLYNFYTSADAFAGNSGSPIIDLANGIVVGIHVRRPYAHYVDASNGQGGQCAAVNTCSATTGCNPNYGESAWAIETRMSYAAVQGGAPLHAALTRAAAATL